MTPPSLFPMPRHPSYRLWAGVAAELLCVALMSRHGNFLERGEAGKFTVLALVAGTAFWLAAHGFQRMSAPAKTRVRWLWIVAVVFRLAMLPTLPGDDLWRYLWEGKVQLHGFNPYQLAPGSAALAGLRDADWVRINHQNVAAIYPPLAELMFAALAWTGNSVLGYKLLFACADLGVIAILRRVLSRGGSSPDTAVWYAWNPLVVYTSAGAAHFDSLMVLAMMGAVWCLDRSSVHPARESGPWQVPPLAWASTGLLGISIALKAVPVVWLPVWFFALGWRHAMVTLPVAVAIAPALALLYGFPDVPVFGGLEHFAGGFQVNNAVWWIVDPANRLGGIYGGVAALVCLALAFWLRRDWRRATLWVMGAALLLSPALHAWYVLWVLPLAVWRGERARAWVVLSVSVFGYFLLWEINRSGGRAWEEPVWLRLLIYLPPLAALGVSFAVRPPGPAEGTQRCYP